MRLGEAAQPGPVIGSLNPSGLMGKCADIGCLPQGTWAIQETHLTVPGLRQFKQELAWKCKGYSVSHGAPAPPKTPGSRTIGGRHTGVAFLSSHPIRSIPNHWTPEEHASGRCHTACAHIQGRWLTMGTVYGYAERSGTIEVQQQTNQLLAGLTSRVVQGATGLRMVAGDWNMDRPHLQQADTWEAQGWQEAQQLAYLKWQKPLQCTCKRVTIKDYVFLSPEVIPYVQDVSVVWDLFPDHAVLQIHLTDLGRPPLVPMWKKPSPIDWPTDKARPEWTQHSQADQDVDQWYANVCHNLEAFANCTLTQHGLPQLRPNQRGRAVTKEVRWVQLNEAPVKPNRQGDVQSELTGTCLQHSRWTRQVRRLQHLSRCDLDTTPSPCQMEHAASLWRKIRQAPGFPGGFHLWWTQQEHHFADTPQFLPDAPPTQGIALAIFTEFLTHYRALESNLTQAKRIHAAQRRAKDPLQIYRDLQRERAEPVQTLVSSTRLPVVSTETISDEQCQVKVGIPLPEGLFTYEHEEISMQVQITGPQTLQVPTATCPDGTDHIAVKHVVGDVTTMIHMFENEWAPRWQRHADPNMHTWTPVLDFIKTALPNKTAAFPPIDLVTWKKAVARKKSWAAIGPDGLSRADLLNAPDCITQDFLDIIQGVEEGQPWPSQALTGVVAALAKVPTAQTVNQYRPITILSMFYRTWSSIRAKQCIAFLQSLIPECILGNVPHKSPRHLWFHVQELIEHSYCIDQEVAGCVIDIIKCFNMLPREPIKAMALAVGLPPGMVNAWHQGLQQLSRRFQVRGSLGGAVLSTCGYPEGCALSVVAMLLVNMTCQLWLTYRMPQVQVWSFVDNIETVTTSTADAIRSLESLHAFCDLLELPVDDAKTYCWTNTSTGRQSIRDAGLNIQYFARDLGGHMAYCKLHTNQTIKHKMDQMAPFWPRLTRTSAPVLQKERALYVAAWPNIFYGISTVTFGQCHFTKLRTKATRALQLHQHGSNPRLQLSCVSDPRCDPEFYCVLQTLVAFRNHQAADLTQVTMTHILEGGSTSQGPCTSVLQALAKLAWTWQENGWCLDHDAIPIHLVSCPNSEFYQRITQAWQFMTFALLEETRPTLLGAKHTDVALTLRSKQSFGAEQQALLRCVLNGTQYTHDALVHAGTVTTSSCKFCDAKDSVHHRTWECPFFQDLRVKHDVMTGQPDQAPLSMTNHAWLPKSSHVAPLKQALLGLPDRTAEFMRAPPSPLPGNACDLFLDGSCVHPTLPDQRVATWGLVMWTGNDFRPVGNGGVPGWHQTSLRGEITAAISALKFATVFQCPVRLWIDNLTVFNQLTAWSQGLPTRWETKKDADLWRQLAWQFHHAKQWIRAILKVKAHVAADAQDTPVDEWAVQGNSQADECAKQARQTLPPHLWTEWHLLTKDQTAMLAYGRRLHALFIAIGERATNSTIQPVALQPLGRQITQRVEWDPGLLHVKDMEHVAIPMHFQIEEAPFVQAWLCDLFASQAPAQWISFHQLLLSYQMHTGRFGPTSTGTKWIDQPVPACGYNHKQQVHWLSQFLTNLARASGHPIQLEQRRPPSSTLAFWCGTIRIGVPMEQLHRIDDYITQFSQALPARQVRHLLNVPPAT